MFRAVLLAVGVVLLAGGVLGVVVGCRTIPMVVFGALLVFGMLFERYIYKPIREEAPGVGWEKTGEMFSDPRTGREVTVYFNARTGERRYVAERDG
jgi:hypothetical protein